MTTSNQRGASKATVTCLPCTAPVVDCQFVASVSSIRRTWFTPSPAATAPLVVDAQLVGKWMRIVFVFPARMSSPSTWKRTSPYPFARAMKL